MSIISSTPTQVPVRSWIRAYLTFLTSRDESFMLKIAPLAIVLGSPELVVANFIPGVGEISDFTSVVLALMIAARTLKAVRRYREL